MQTLGTEFAKVLATSSTDTSFASRVATTTEPTGDGVIGIAPLAGRPGANLFLVPYGAGNDDTTFDMRVIGWRKVSTLWVPVPLCQVSCTLSTAVGVAGAAVTNSERFADTITLATGYNSNVSVEVVSPTGNVVGHVLLDAKGCSKVEVTFDLTGATSANCLYARV